jgi:hypothetical protein
MMLRIAVYVSNQPAALSIVFRLPAPKRMGKQIKKKFPGYFPDGRYDSLRRMPVPEALSWCSPPAVRKWMGIILRLHKKFQPRQPMPRDST